MVNYFDKLYSSIPPVNSGHRILDKIRFYSVLRFLVRSLANIIIPLYYTITMANTSFQLNKNQEGSSTKKIIVTLTSFPTRINNVWLVVESILRQKIKPDKIILWLSKEQFDGFESLPGKLIKQTKRGLEVWFVDGDIRSHKKYYYAMQKFPEDLIITVDDDILYRDNLIQLMLKYHDDYPFNIISFYCRKIKRDKGRLCAYNSWPKATEEEASISELFFGSGGGTLFPSHSIHEDVFNIDLFMKLTPLADDIWLNAMSRLNETYIYSICNKNWIPLPVINKKNKTLAKQNVSENLNDNQIENVRSYYIDKNNIDPFEIKTYRSESLDLM